MRPRFGPVTGPRAVWKSLIAHRSPASGLNAESGRSAGDSCERDPEHLQPRRPQGTRFSRPSRSVEIAALRLGCNGPLDMIFDARCRCRLPPGEPRSAECPGAVVCTTSPQCIGLPVATGGLRRDR
jgi:hypothetical protein